MSSACLISSARYVRMAVMDTQSLSVAGSQSKARAAAITCPPKYS